jgi:hypothetical protein
MDEALCGKAADLVGLGMVKVGLPVGSFAQTHNLTAFKAEVVYVALGGCGPN